MSPDVRENWCLWVLSAVCQLGNVQSNESRGLDLEIGSHRCHMLKYLGISVKAGLSFMFGAYV